MSKTLTRTVEVELLEEDYADAGFFEAPDQADLVVFLDALLAGDVDLARAVSDRVFLDEASRHLCQLRLTSALRRAA